MSTRSPEPPSPDLPAAELPAAELPVADLASRLARAAAGVQNAGLDALLVTPGPDLRYLVGYDAVPLERLTCLLVAADGPTRVVVPRLERAAALASPLGRLGVDLVAWEETEDPYALVATLLPGARRVALDHAMAAEKVLRLRAAMPQAEQVLAGPVLGPLRRRKSAAEVAALARAGAAIDRVHAQVAALLRPGRTERAVGAEIAELITAEGHVRVDFVIVASGPNGASPHHQVSDRVLAAGDVVVVDIGGTMPDGYCSDETRTYALGAPDPAIAAEYAVLQAAQAAAVAHVRPGVTAASVDAAARDVLAEAGLGELFIHRTGHGIGLETHEEPYIVVGNDLPLEPGHAFSIEPGVYREGVYGARIEDIVVCGESAAQVLNHRPHDLVVVPV